MDLRTFNSCGSLSLIDRPGRGGDGGRRSKDGWYQAGESGGQESERSMREILYKVNSSETKNNGEEGRGRRGEAGEGNTY